MHATLRHVSKIRWTTGRTDTGQTTTGRTGTDAQWTDDGDDGMEGQNMDDNNKTDSVARPAPSTQHNDYTYYYH